MKIKEKAKKVPEDAMQAPYTKSRQMVNYGLDDPLNGMLPSDYTKPLTAVEYLRRSLVLISLLQSCFAKWAANEIYQHVKPFLRMFLIWNANRANIFFWM